MQKIIKIWLMLFLTLAGELSAQARLTINITQGVSQQIPVAVMPFSEQVIKNTQLPEGIAGVIADDLRNTSKNKTHCHGT